MTEKGKINWFVVCLWNPREAKNKKVKLKYAKTRRLDQKHDHSGQIEVTDCNHASSESEVMGLQVTFMKKVKRYLRSKMNVVLF